MRTNSWPRVLASAAALVALFGCFRSSQVVDVYPDGSGSIRISVGTPYILDPSVTDSLVASRAADHCEGFVAITDATVRYEDGWQTLEFTGWFDDANEARVGQADRTSLRLSWTASDDGFVLEAQLDAVVRLANMALESARERTEDPESSNPFGNLVTDEVKEKLDLRTEIRLPGPVRTVEGFEKVDERTVRFVLKGAEMDDLDRMRGLVTQAFRVRCGPSTLSRSDVDAFRKRLAEARKAWNARPEGQVVEAIEAASFKVEEGRFTTPLDGARLFVSPESTNIEKTAMLYDRDGKRVFSFPATHGVGSKFLLAPDATRLHVATPGRVATFAVPSGALIWEVSGPEVEDPPYWSAEVLPNGDLLVFEERQDTPFLLDGKSGARRSTKVDLAHGAVLAATSDPNVVLVCREDCTQFALAELTSGELRWTLPATFGGQSRVDGSAVYTKSGLVPDDETVVAVSGNSSGREFAALDAKTGRVRWRRRFPNGTLIASWTGRYLLFYRSDMVWLIDAGSGRTLGRVRGIPEHAREITFSAGEELDLWLMEEVDKVEFIRRFRLELPK